MLLVFLYSTQSYIAGARKISVLLYHFMLQQQNYICSEKANELHSIYCQYIDLRLFLLLVQLVGIHVDKVSDVGRFYFQKI